MPWRVWPKWVGGSWAGGGREGSWGISGMGGGGHLGCASRADLEGGPNSRGTGDALMGCVGQQWDGGRWEVGGGGNTAGLGATWGGGHLNGTPWMGAAINGGGCPAPPPPPTQPQSRASAGNQGSPPPIPTDVQTDRRPCNGEGATMELCPPPLKSAPPSALQLPPRWGGVSKDGGGGERPKNTPLRPSPVQPCT